jgi:hypothetical protein
MAKSRGLVGIVRAGGRTLQDREGKDITLFARFRAADRHYPQLLDVLRAVSFHRPATGEGIWPLESLFAPTMPPDPPFCVFPMA